MLKNTLRVNAFFSLSSGLILLVAGPWVVDLLGAGAPWILRLIGAGLILFAVDLFMTSRKTPLHTNKVHMIIWMDVAWVVGSIVLLLVAGSAFSTAGITVVVLVAAIVALFAALQYVGLRKERSTTTFT